MNEEEFAVKYQGKSPTLLFLTILILGLGTSVASGQDAVIRAGKIYTVTKGTIENGEILVQDGKIRALGHTIDTPQEVEIHNAEVVIPGLIDAHTHLALNRSGRAPGPITAEWKAVEHLNLEDKMLQVALAGGVTSIVTRPGSGIICSGQSVALKLKRHPEVLKPYVDLKFAIRPLVKLRPGETPATAMGWYATASEMFRRAKEPPCCAVMSWPTSTPIIPVRS
jgi:imidazolonepropionase-like amidohydrolase